MPRFHPINDKREWYREQYLKSEHWANLRARKLQLFNTCKHCGAGNGLDVHHLRYKRLFNVGLRDLIVLCRPCHTAEHERLEALKERFNPKRRAGPPKRRVFHAGHSERWVQPGRKFFRENQKINAIRDQIIANAAKSLAEASPP
jgi:5-methylcytosine-specific restriction endonuclease McrA